MGSQTGKCWLRKHWTGVYVPCEGLGGRFGEDARGVRDTWEFDFRDLGKVGTANGRRTPAHFTSNVFANIYHGHVQDLEDIRKANLPAYNALLRRLFIMAA